LTAARQIIMDELLDKFLKDEVTPEQFDEGFAKLTDEDKTKVLANPELTKKLAGANTAALEALKGVRKAKKIIEGDKPDYAATLRKENIAKASKRFFEKFKIPAEEQASYLANLESTHTSTVGEDLLYGGLAQAYASTHADELLSSKEKLDSMQQGAEEFNAGQGGAPGSVGDKNPDGTQRDPEVLRWMQDAVKAGNPFESYEAAQKALSQGTKRVIG